MPLVICLLLYCFASIIYQPPIMTFKQQVHEHYLHRLQEKIQHLQQVLAELKESGANETKSTAGDKHETALAMLQIEQANKREQLRELEQQLAALEKINPAIVPAMIVPGSLVHTDQGYLYLSIAGGKAVIAGKVVTALSSQSPLGKLLLTLQPGQTASVNSHHYHIIYLE